MTWRLAVVLAVTLGCLLWVIWGLDVGVAAGTLAVFRWWFLLPMAACYTAAHLARTWRFRTLLGGRSTYGRILSITSIGFLAINVVPLRLGELVRPYLFLEQARVPVGESLAAVAMERLLDLVVLLIMLLLAGVLVELPPGGVAVMGVDVVAAGQGVATAGVALGLGAGGAMVIAGEPVISRLERALALLQPTLSRQVAGLLRGARQVMVDAVQRPLTVGLLAVQSLLVWGATVGGLAMVLMGIHGHDLGLAAAVVVWAVTIAAMVVAPTPGFLGTFEVAAAAALGLLGLDPHAAVAMAVLIHLGQFGCTAGVGLLFLVKEGLSLGGLVRRSRDIAPQTGESPRSRLSGRAAAD